MLSRIKFEIRPLVREMLDQLPASVWSSDTTTFFDPAMGGGQFVGEIERRLRAHGHTDTNISSRVYGFEYNQALVDLAVNMNKLVGQYARVPYDDFFGWETDMKFDVVVGNPPYQLPDSKTSGGGHTLWKQFCNRCTDPDRSLIRSGGFMAFVTPAVPYHNKKGIGLAMRTQQLYRVRSDASCYFPGVGSAFAWWILQNTLRYQPTEIVDLGYSIDVSTVPPGRQGFQPQIALSIMDKYDRLLQSMGHHGVMSDTGIKSADLCDVQDADHPYPVRWGSPRDNKFRYSTKKSPNHHRPKVAGSLSGNPHWGYFSEHDGVSTLATMSAYLLVNDADQARRFIDQQDLKINRFRRYCNRGSGAFSGVEDYQTIKFSLDRDIHDSEAYDLMGLTVDEVAHIDSVIA